MTGALPIAAPLTLMAGSLARTPFREQVAAAAAAGFGAMTGWPNVWRHAQRKDGLSLTDMRRLLTDNGIALTDVDACSDWAAPSDVDVPLPSASRAEFFDACVALGGSTVVAVHPILARPVTAMDIAGFGELCDQAAAHGLRVALEFMPFSGVPDLATALRVLNEVDRPNAGLVVDLAHLARGGGKPEDLRDIPAERVFTVQLADGPRAAPEDLLDEAMLHRQLPGHGDFPLTECLQTLASIGVRAPAGAEVYRPDCADRPPVEVAAELYRSTVDLLTSIT